MTLRTVKVPTLSELARTHVLYLCVLLQDPKYRRNNLCCDISSRFQSVDPIYRPHVPDVVSLNISQYQQGSILAGGVPNEYGIVRSGEQ